MKLRKFELNPVEQQPFGMNKINEELQGCSHVETYTKPRSSCGDDRSIVIFAFFTQIRILCIERWMIKH